MTSRPPLLRLSGVQAIKALLELAEDPGRWRSVRDLAAAQDFPLARLEQLLLRLRRDGLVQAQRGRLGGYRLALPAKAIPLQRVLLAAAGAHRPPEPSNLGSLSPGAPEGALPPTALVTLALAAGIPNVVPIEFAGQTVAIAVASLLLIGPLGGLVSVRLAVRVEPLIALGLSQ